MFKAIPIHHTKKKKCIQIMTVKLITLKHVFIQQNMSLSLKPALSYS